MSTGWSCIMPSLSDLLLLGLTVSMSYWHWAALASSSCVDLCCAVEASVGALIEWERTRRCWSEQQQDHATDSNLPIQSSQFCQYYNVRLLIISEWFSSSWVHILLTVRLLYELVLHWFICLFVWIVTVMSLCVDVNAHSTNMPTTSIQTEMLLLPTPSQLSQQGMKSNPLIGPCPAHTLGMVCCSTDMNVCEYVEGEYAE